MTTAPEDHPLRAAANRLLASRTDDEARTALDGVLAAINDTAADIGLPVETLEVIRAEKARERGGFARRIVWAGNQ